MLLKYKEVKLKNINLSNLKIYLNIELFFVLFVDILFIYVLIILSFIYYHFFSIYDKKEYFYFIYFLRYL
jgi:hypothetical protein